jgi:predicted acylesterase/phospholipase RssA
LGNFQSRQDNAGSLSLGRLQLALPNPDPMLPESPSPFGPIALSLSGGGYRAAGFHLGVLDMLHRLDLLQDVSALSTVSGGTFTGVRYALSQKACESFETFFEKFSADLLSINVVDLALTQLTRGAPTIPSGRWDVITACAQVYDEKFFGHKRFNVFWEGPCIPLTELIFNATEFHNAIAFRFQKRGEDRRAKIGNGDIFITPEQAQQIRLADIVAASSCFPGGFEPLSFPNDFHWPDTPDGALALKQLQAMNWAPLPLMDGGVYDNQGMGSLTLGDQEHLKKFGLFIFSDSEPQQPDLYTLPKPRPAGWMRLWHLKVLWWILFLLGLGTAVVAARLINLHEFGWTNLLETFPLAMAIGSVLTLLWVRIKITDALRHVPKIKGSAWGLVKNLKVNQFIDMMELRISSLFALASSIFMRRIRRLVYKSVMGDDLFKGKTVPTLIYDLLEADTFQPPLDWLNPSPAACEVACAADKLPTTLWFTGPEQLPHLIACGQMTICRKVLLHILKLSGDNQDAVPPHLRALFDKARAFFRQLNGSPYALAAGPGAPTD